MSFRTICWKELFRSEILLLTCDVVENHCCFSVSITFSKHFIIFLRCEISLYVDILTVAVVNEPYIVRVNAVNQLSLLISLCPIFRKFKCIGALPTNHEWDSVFVFVQICINHFVWLHQRAIFFVLFILVQVVQQYWVGVIVLSIAWRSILFFRLFLINAKKVSDFQFDFVDLVRLSRLFLLFSCLEYCFTLGP